MRIRYEGSGLRCRIIRSISPLGVIQWRDKVKHTNALHSQSLFFYYSMYNLRYFYLYDFLISNAANSK